MYYANSTIPVNATKESAKTWFEAFYCLTCVSELTLLLNRGLVYFSSVEKNLFSSVLAETRNGLTDEPFTFYKDARTPLEIRFPMRET